MAINLAKDPIFGKEEMIWCSLNGRKNTATLDKKKPKIKNIQSRVPIMPETKSNIFGSFVKVNNANLFAPNQKGNW